MEIFSSMYVFDNLFNVFHCRLHVFPEAAVFLSDDCSDSAGRGFIHIVRQQSHVVFCDMPCILKLALQYVFQEIFVFTMEVIFYTGSNNCSIMSDSI